ncbi:L-seryl-tRNA(Sec) selenium transferase, partial [bacterium]|nr:L-seryl-tRNA(Sec) selenium transferase [bacterium]
MKRDIQLRLRMLPAVDKILSEVHVDLWRESPLTTTTIREVLDEIRKEIMEGREDVPSIHEIAKLAVIRLEKRHSSRLKRVINGTGIIIHTNLGRSPLSEEAIQAMVQAARGYSSLEYDIEEGKRGSRHSLVQHLLVTLTHAEDALVTNNNASALLLALMALAYKKEVIVSRGQLVEIGGSFRIPEICKAGGVKLVEVGTTNRTRIEDYRNAVTNKTALLLRVHTSNFRVIGFTEEVKLSELIALGEEIDVPIVDDLGSGALVDPGLVAALRGEPLVHDSIQAGADVITLSGDKLLGGPQAGIAVGKEKAISRMRKH